MITQSGPKCDVCGRFILPTDPDERVHTFSMPGIKGTLHCDNACKSLILESTEKGADGWKELPDGPIRQLFEKQAQVDG